MSKAKNISKAKNNIIKIRNNPDHEYPLFLKHVLDYLMA